MKSKSNLARQRGAITFVEALGVLIVASLLMPAVWGWLADDADNKLNVATADHDKQVIRAAAQYIKDNYATVLANASASTPATITVLMLQSQYPQLFATGYSARNPYAQAVTVQAYQTVPGSLDTLIVTSGGQTISERNMRKVAQLVGGAGGYISSSNPNVAVGTYGGWGPKTIPGSPGAGHMAYSLMFQDGSLVSDYLYRKAVPGHPELNQMNTAIDMNNNNVSKANQISSQSLKTLADGSLGAPSVTLANGKVISFNQVGEGGVLGLVGNNGQAVYLESNNGAFRLVNSPWNAQLFSVDQGGNVISAGTVTAAGAQVNGDASIAGVLRATGTGYYDTAPNNNLYLKPWNPGGEVVIGGGGGSGVLHATNRIYTDEYLSGGGAAPGAGCSQNGLLGRDSNGALSCENGVWKSLRGAFSVTTYTVPINASQQYLGVHAYCSLGQLSGGPEGGFQQVVTDGANNWWGTNLYWADGKWADPNIVVNCINLPGAGV